MFEKEPLICMAAVISAGLYSFRQVITAQKVWNRGLAGRFFALSFLAYDFLPASILAVAINIYDLEGTEFITAILGLTAFFKWLSAKTRVKGFFPVVIIIQTVVNLMMIFAIKIMAFVPRGDWTLAVKMAIWHIVFTITLFAAGCITLPKGETAKK